MAKNDPEEAWAAYVVEVGLRLNRFRHAAGLSQETLANRVGITRNHYQLLEKGKSTPTKVANPQLRVMVALAEVLGVDLTELLPPAAGVAVGG
ncbi:helix-turn-helix transcriptional regulator [Arthrobacter sp. MI7-26]|uniref:helix-turn-helix domain-containing protein n=1 Tax=Arthrobacter sp. MI7-26 TaxID=2993653 RepID=UPI00224979E9|nr:helix-turn-helix transcriptional regulator [Arthrobacter sp. MI7-26]MCX2746264.1 helix-turn-helix transcriptional regulator [Arthrobacter sp. MI7-26]